MDDVELSIGGGGGMGSGGGGICWSGNRLDRAVIEDPLIR